MALRKKEYNHRRKDRKVKIREINDYWLDFGNPEDIKKVSDFIKNGRNKTIAESLK